MHMPRPTRPTHHTVPRSPFSCCSIGGSHWCCCRFVTSCGAFDLIYLEFAFVFQFPPSAPPSCPFFSLSFLGSLALEFFNMLHTFVRLQLWSLFFRTPSANPTPFGIYFFNGIYFKSKITGLRDFGIGKRRVFQLLQLLEHSKLNVN